MTLGTPQLVFVSTDTLERVASVDVDGASVVPLLWHPKLNQIIAGNADGASYVMYDPTMSEKGAMICTAKRAPKRAALSYTGGAMHIMTPHALPMFKVRVRARARVTVTVRLALTLPMHPLLGELT